MFDKLGLGDLVFIQYHGWKGTEWVEYKSVGWVIHNYEDLIEISATRVIDGGLPESGDLTVHKSAVTDFLIIDE